MAGLSKRTSSAALALGLLLMILTAQCYEQGPLTVGFYKGKCKADVESIVFSVVKEFFLKNRGSAAGLIRLNYHDCYVRGCDASILLDGKNTEKTAPPNLTLEGFEIIDAIKTTLEQSCPNLVSCADIIVIAARVATFLAGGKWYNVETGRRDGLVSLASEAENTLPSTSTPIPQMLKAFAKIGLDVNDFVVLQGAHTVGRIHCGNFQDRMYDYNSMSGRSDPSISSTFLSFLEKTCPRNGDGSNYTFLDQYTGLVFDNKFYQAIMAKKGVMQMDQAMALSPQTKDIVAKLATGTEFLDKFGDSLVKMSRIGVLTGQKGQIRKSCRAVNRS